MTEEQQKRLAELRELYPENIVPKTMSSNNSVDPDQETNTEINPQLDFTQDLLLKISSQLDDIFTLQQRAKKSYWEYEEIQVMDQADFYLIRNAGKAGWEIVCAFPIDVRTDQGIRNVIHYVLKRRFG